MNFKSFILAFVLQSFFLQISLFGLDADFSIFIENPCAPSLVVFQNESSMGAGIEYRWDFGKEAIISSNEKTLSESYTEAGEYTITLTAIEGGNTVSTSQNITVVEGPHANFNTQYLEGCIPLENTFTDNSTPGDSPITEYLWLFLDGNSGTGNEINYTYTVSGAHGIYLKITDANGCSSDIESTDIIQVYDLPKVAFTASDSFSCEAPLEVEFKNQSSGFGILDYNWDFGNGQSSSNITGTTLYQYNTSSYDVTLSVTDEHGCSDTLRKESYITTGARTGSILAQQGDSIWSTDGGLLCPGEIKLRTDLPQLDDIHWVINYAGSTQTFDGMKEVDFLVPDSGRIDIMLSYNEASGCGDTLYKYFIIDYIKAEFEMSESYTCQLPLTVNMTNNSGNAVSYTWWLPDDTISSLTDITHTFPIDTSYRQKYTHDLIDTGRTVILIAVNEYGCSDTVSHTLKYSLPVARFMPDIVTGCVPLEITLSDSSVSAEDIGEWTYLIDGEEIVRTNNNPLSYTFDTPGDYPISLIVENESSCIDTSYTVMIEVGQKLYPNFSVTPETICSGDRIYLSDETPNPELIDNWQYSSPDLFNTGSFERPDTNLIINSPSNGSKDVRLLVESNGCLSDTVLTDVFSVESPTGYFDVDFDCASPLEYKFTAVVESADNLLWTVNGIDYPDIAILDYTFAGAGDYLVKLSISNSTSGCSLTKSKIIPVREVHADFISKPIGCPDEDIEFNASESIDYINECYNEGFLWNFNDGNPPRRNYNTSHFHSFSALGIYSVQLIVTGKNGCSDTTASTIEIVQPEIDFTVAPESGCGPSLDVIFNYTNYTSEIDNWYWNFGDLQFDNTDTLSPSHTYYSANDRSFFAYLFVEDIYGCTNTLTKEIEIKTPDANFYAIKNGICLGDEVQFRIPDTNIENYTWFFGDGDSSSTSNSHIYVEPGIYTINLSLEKDGCTATRTRSNYISVEVADASYLLSDSLPTCYPALIEFEHTGTSSISRGTWIFQNGVQSPTYSRTPQFNYSEPGIYNTSLTITTNNGCMATSNHTIEVTGPTADYSFFPTSICSGDTVQFELENMDGVEDFLWTFGDGETSNLEDPRHTYTDRGSLEPSLVLIQGDCEVILSDYPLIVSTLRADFELQIEEDFICLNAPFSGVNQSDDYNSSIWSINGNQVATSEHLIDSLDQTGENSISLEVSNTIGCSDNLELIVNVLPLPEFSITGDSSICLGNDFAELHVDPQTNWSILWEPDSLIPNPNQFTIRTSPDTASWITARLTDGSGCESIQEFLIWVIEPSTIRRIPLQDTSIYAGETLQLFIDTDNDETQFTWTPDYHISCTNCISPVVHPYENTTYIVSVLDECLDVSLEFPVEVIFDFYLELPSAFSPNGDGQNDIFSMEHYNVAEADFKIFNRWGNLMFSTQDLNEGWDGRSSDKLQNPDTYAYIIRAVSIHGYEFERKGTFILLR